jgi:hypothetical protein
MTNPNPLDSFRRRAVRHAFEDGAIDLVVGVFTLMVGVATQRRIFLALTVVYLGAMAMAWKWLHDGLTSRRTGFAELPDYPPRQLLSVILLAGCLTMGIVAALTLTSGRLWNLEAWPTWTPLVSGLILAGGFLHTALRTGFARFHLYTVVSIGASLFFWLFPFGSRINPSDRLTLPFFVLAAVLFIVGAVTVARFVRNRPVVSQEVSGDR